jgi:hypothetical protein
MGHDVGAAEPAARSAAAQRMRRYRHRRRRGLRCFVIVLHEAEVNALIHKGLLKTKMRNHLSAVRGALYVHLDRTLGSGR